MKNFRVLLTNDDGIEAAGLMTLEERLRTEGMEVLVSAPDQERSGASHSFTLRRMLRIHEHGPDRYAVSGTPVDAVHMAVNLLFKDCRPELVISGINRGANLACDIHYSGTAAAAREGAILGIPAFAVSLETRKEDADFGPSADVAVKVASLIREHGLEERTFLNVNVPELPASKIEGVKVTVQGIRSYDNIVHVQEDPFGDPVYWLGGLATGGRPVPDSDIEAVEQGYVSVTPLRLDLTKRSELDRLRSILGNGASPWSKP